MLKSLIKRLKTSAGETDELAAARRSLLNGGCDLPAWNPDDLVSRKGLDIYDRMQTDSQISACLTTKKFAVLSRGWRIIPGGDSPGDREAADFCIHMLKNMRGSTEDFLFGVLDALAKGYSICEINFLRIPSGVYAGRIGLDSIKHKDPSLYEFKTDAFLNITALTRLPADGGNEQDLPPEKFVLYTYMPTYEDPHGRSDLRCCYKHWWTKEIIQRFFAAHIERFGTPVVKGTYKRGTARQQQEELLRILDRIQHETAIVIPEDVTVEILEAAVRGEQGYLDAITYHDRQIAKAILGQTLTQEEGQRTGALALAKVHQDTLALRLQKVKRDLEESVMREQVLRRLVRLNYPDAEVPRFILGSLEGRDMSQQSVVLERLMRAGVVRPDEGWVREWLGVPQEEGEKFGKSQPAA